MRVSIQRQKPLSNMSSDMMNGPFIISSYQGNEFGKHGFNNTRPISPKNGHPKRPMSSINRLRSHKPSLCLGPQRPLSAHTGARIHNKQGH